jgi:hypothetical protein
MFLLCHKPICKYLTELIKLQVTDWRGGVSFCAGTGSVIYETHQASSPMFSGGLLIGINTAGT